MTRAEARVVLELKQHAAQEAVRAIVRIAGTAPAGTETATVGTALALLEAKSKALRAIGASVIPDDLVADCAREEGGRLDTLLAAAGPRSGAGRGAPR